MKSPFLYLDLNFYCFFFKLMRLSCGQSIHIFMKFYLELVMAVSIGYTKGKYEEVIQCFE